MKQVTRRIWVASMMLALLGLSGCKVSLDRVAKWKKKGDTARLKKCLSDKKQSLKVRTASGLALVDLGNCYGVEAMLARVHKRSSTEASTLADRMAKELLPQLKGLDDGSIKAKDGLFSVWRFATVSVRANIEDRLVKWLLDHYVAAATAGEHSAAKILSTMGPLASNVLAKYLTLDHPKLYEIAGIIRKTADASAKKTITGRIISNLKANPGKMSRPQVLYTLGRLCMPSGVSYLQNLATAGMNYKIRREALISLRLCPNPKSIAIAGGILKTILDSDIKGTPVELPSFDDRKPGVIGQCFELMDTVHHWPLAKKALRPLLITNNNAPLPQDAQDQKLLIRMQGAQFAVYMGGLDGLKMILADLPKDVYPPIYVNTPALAIRQKFAKGKDRINALAGLRQTLKNGSLVAKMIAIKSLARIGEKTTDLPLLRALARDRTPVAGWKPGTTIGVLASTAAERLAGK
ncbi:MAG: hypothetical protein J7M25_13285 [Deltaproteobacteria bacterium]|nr:hypothetical protein [Deltaproteobacteria bacterium]